PERMERPTLAYSSPFPRNRSNQTLPRFPPPHSPPKKSSSSFTLCNHICQSGQARNLETLRRGSKGASQFLYSAGPLEALPIELGTRTDEEANLQSRHLIVPSSERGCVVLDQPRSEDSASSRAVGRCQHLQIQAGALR